MGDTGLERKHSCTLNTSFDLRDFWTSQIALIILHFKLTWEWKFFFFMNLCGVTVFQTWIKGLTNIYKKLGLPGNRRFLERRGWRGWQRPGPPGVPETAQPWHPTAEEGGHDTARPRRGSGPTPRWRRARPPLRLHHRWRQLRGQSPLTLCCWMRGMCGKRVMVSICLAGAEREILTLFKHQREPA